MKEFQPLVSVIINCYNGEEFLENASKQDPNYYAAKLASKFVKVVLSGAGGDELFAGYPWRYYRNINNSNFDSYIDNYYSYWQRLLSNTEFKSVFNSLVSDNYDGSFTRDIFLWSQRICNLNELTPPLIGQAPL